jgi:hypothetical protein
MGSWRYNGFDNKFFGNKVQILLKEIISKNENKTLINIEPIN